MLPRARDRQMDIGALLHSGRFVDARRVQFDVSTTVAAVPSLSSLALGTSRASPRASASVALD